MTRIGTAAAALAALLGASVLLSPSASAQTSGACAVVTDQNRAYCATLLEAQQATARAAAVQSSAAAAAAVPSSAQDRVRERPNTSPNCPAPSKGRPCRSF